MTELETLERAKMYMEKLANGMNPIDGSMIPDEDVVNNVRLSRCFFYVADVLRRVIDNGGIEKQKKSKKLCKTVKYCSQTLRDAAKNTKQARLTALALL